MAAADIDDDDDEKLRRINERVLKELKKEQQLYSTSELNDKLYLHYRGFKKIEGLGEWTGLKALWLEGNGFGKIEGLDKLDKLRCLYLHQNCIKRIENLGCCPSLATLQLSNNFIGHLENLSCLRSLSTLQIANNCLATADDIRHLVDCPNMTVLDLQNNRLDDDGILDILESLPQLAVLQLQGNPIVRKISNYRKSVISRCKALAYMDDRPVFEEERLAVEAWLVGGLPAEREERRRQRAEKDNAHRRNLEHMMKLMRGCQEKQEAPPLAEGDDEAEGEAGRRVARTMGEGTAAAKNSLTTTGSAMAAKARRISEKEMYEKALSAVEAKRLLLQQQAELKREAEAAGEDAGSRLGPKTSEEVLAQLSCEAEHGRSGASDNAAAKESEDVGGGQALGATAGFNVAHDLDALS